jgi:hypothetical protein
MTRSTYSLARALVACAGLALCASALPAAAQQTQQTEQADQAAVQTANSVTVTRDAETGKLRASTAAEQAGMQASKVRSLMRVATPQPMQKVHASGARGVRLTDEMVNASAEVAVRAPDGRIVIAHGSTEADAKASATTPATE